MCSNGETVGDMPLSTFRHDQGPTWVVRGLGLSGSGPRTCDQDGRRSGSEHLGLVQAASAVATNVDRVGHAALGFGRPQRCWRSLRMRARSRRWAASTSGWRAWALRQRR
jgi:hypothetical protein